MEVSDGGERTKEDRIGDRLVMSEKKQRGRLKSYSTTSCQSYNTTVESQDGGREGWREGKWSMTLTLTDHCSMTV